MAQLFHAGETKIRPGVYYRFTGQNASSAASLDGVNAIVINASWGPSGTVTVHDTANSIKETYGSGEGVEAALMLKSAGASKVYICRPTGSGGAKGTVELGGGTISAKYDGERALVVKVQAKPGDSAQKQVIILEGTTMLETFDFAVGDSSEGTALSEVLAGSKYVTYTLTTSAEATVGEYKLVGGKNPTMTAQDYLAGFQALEPYKYNVLTTDSEDEAVAAVMQAYMEEAALTGKLFIGVVGAPTSVAFETRLAKAKAFNDKQIVYFGSGFTSVTGEIINGVKAINYAAGVISSTPSNQSIVHTAVTGAVDTTEKLTNAQYEEAIRNGLLLLSIGPDGQIWFDSGVNTLVTPAGNEDDGWKKIKRTKTRVELMDRIDRAVSPLVGKVGCDSDGVAAIVQAGMGVITSMIAERKLMTGATMTLDADNPYTADSAWFVIQADDIDTLEKIYLHYQFRYSQNV